MKYDIVKLMARRKIRWKKRWVSGDSGGRLTFRSKKAGRLSDYRIYGNTVGGESVGDRTGNLFDGEIMIGGLSDSTGSKVDGILTRLRTSWIKVEPSKTYSFNLNNLDYKIRNIYVYNESKSLVYTSEISSNSATVTVSSLASYVRFVFKKNDGSETVTISDCREKFMFNTGSTPLPYEPYGYKVPVSVSNGSDTLTTPIYLPEQMRKVGDEAEYVDYKEQKQHRVRKNLLPNIVTSRTINGVTFTVNSDGSVTCNGKASALTIVYLGGNKYTLSKGTYKLTGCPINGTGNTFCQDLYSSSINLTRDYGDGVEFNVTTNDIISVRLIIFSDYTCDNLTFYPMIRKADIEDDTYEPYIENTDLNVTLHALPTLTGTNVLSVGTAVQPSRVEVKGRIKAVGQETEPEPEAAEPEPEAAEAEPETAEPEQETAEAEQEAAEPEQEEPEVKEDDTDDR